MASFRVLRVSPSTPSGVKAQFVLILTIAFSVSFTVMGVEWSIGGDTAEYLGGISILCLLSVYNSL